MVDDMGIFFFVGVCFTFVAQERGFYKRMCGPCYVDSGSKIC